MGLTVNHTTTYNWQCDACGYSVTGSYNTTRPHTWHLVKVWLPVDDCFEWMFCSDACRDKAAVEKFREWSEDEEWWNREQK